MKTHPIFGLILKDFYSIRGYLIRQIGLLLVIYLIIGVAMKTMSMLPAMLMLGVTMVAAPGVPGGAVMAALGILESMLGFDADMQGLMIALYIAQDSFGTACNVTGDGAIAVLMDAITSKKEKKANA